VGGGEHIITVVPINASALCPENNKLRKPEKNAKKGGVSEYRKGYEEKKKGMSEDTEGRVHSR